jgi:D-glycero-D-manno-heptose 1,7-bisphosphate phosphatase
MMQAAAFIDRDGVINRDLGHVHRIEDFEVLPGVVQGLRQLAARGFALVVVTNQAGIAKGLYGPAEFEALTTHMKAWFQAQGVVFSGVFHCPHHPQGSVAQWARSCHCRKPEPGLILQAARTLRLDLPRSVMVGDKLSDMQAAERAGLGLRILVESGHALPQDTRQDADHRCAGLQEAAQWICGQAAVNERAGAPAP